MQYDFYNTDHFYKPSLAIKARDRLHNKILSYLPEFRTSSKEATNFSFLEVGIGFGEFADYCKRKKLGWTGIDANKNLIANLKAQGFAAYESFMPKFPEVQEPANAIFASHFIEHLKDYQEALRFMESSRDILIEKNEKDKSKGKYLILLYPDIEKIGHYFWQDYTHSFVTSKKRINDMLYDTGYEVVKTGRYTACFFATSTLISIIGKVFPFFLLPPKIRLFAKLSFQQHSFSIAKVK